MSGHHVIRADEAEQIEHSPSPPTIEAEPLPPTSVEPTPSPSAATATARIAYSRIAAATAA